MKRLLLDCDGVLADFTSAAIDLVNELLGSAFTVRDVKHFDFCASLSLHPNDAAKVKRAIGDSQSFARRIPVYPGAVEGLGRLHELAEIFIVTSPWNSNPSWTHDREMWLWKHFGIKSRNVIHTSAKHVCVGDVFVDDKTEACEGWREAHPRGVAVKWQTPHNGFETWGGPATSSWDELFDIVRGAA